MSAIWTHFSSAL